MNNSGVAGEKVGLFAIFAPAKWDCDNPVQGLLEYQANETP